MHNHRQHEEILERSSPFSLGLKFELLGSIREHDRPLDPHRLPLGARGSGVPAFGLKCTSHPF